MLRQIICPSLRLVGRTSTTNDLVRKMYAAQYHKGPTMDDLPVPSGSWKEHYKAKQSKYNLNLTLSVLFFAISLVAGKFSGLLYLNFSPPRLPED